MAIPEFTTEELQSEEWRVIPSFPNYEASSLGQVRRTATNKFHPNVRLLRGYIANTGYRKLSIYRDGKFYSVNAHNLVTEAFLGPRPAGWVTNHLDADRSNNRVANLEYTTYKGNALHAKALGRLATGDRSGSRIHRDKLPRGDGHWTRRRPELVLRGDRNGARLHPEIHQGERNAHSKLTNAAVIEIRRLYATGQYRQIDLAQMFGVERSVIGKITLRKAWKHI